jgi:hypothetical protein
MVPMESRDDDEIECLRQRLSLMTKIVRDGRDKVKRCVVWHRVNLRKGDEKEAAAWRLEAVAWATRALRARHQRQLLKDEIRTRVKEAGNG